MKILIKKIQNFTCFGIKILFLIRSLHVGNQIKSSQLRKTLKFRFQFSWNGIFEPNKNFMNNLLKIQMAN